MSPETETGLPVKEGKYLATIICWLLGNGCLFAWNSMLTIEDYYTKIFPSYHPTRVLTLVYEPCALGTVALLAYREATINTRIRNLTGYTLFFISSLLLIVLDVATFGRGGVGPFIGVCILGGAFGVADAHVQGGMVGDLSFMCPEFMQSFLAGLAASGALTSALRLITRAAFEDSQDGLRKGAIMFFAISSLFELLCVLLYAFIFPKLPIVRHYRSKAASEGSMTVSADLAAAGIQNPQYQGAEEDPKRSERLSSKQLLLENKDYAFDLYMIYALTLSIFPGFLSEDTGSHSLVMFFAISSLFELLCVLLYAFIFPKLPIVRHYRSKAASEGSMTVSADLAAAGIQNPQYQGAEEDPKRSERLSSKQLLLENKDYAFDLYMIYALTLSIFPGFLSEDTGSHSLGSWYALVLIAMFNVWDLIGRYVPAVKLFKITSRKVLMAATLSRLLLIPAFFFTAKYGDQGYMILLTSFLGLSNGHLTVCVLTAAPKGYKGPEQNALGNLLVLFLVGGIFSGVMLDWLWLIGEGW